MSDTAPESLIFTFGKFLGVVTAFIAVITFIFSEIDKIGERHAQKVAQWQPVVVNSIIECAPDEDIRFDQIMCEFRARALCDNIPLNIENFGEAELRRILMNLREKRFIEYRGRGIYRASVSSAAESDNQQFRLECESLKTRNSANAYCKRAIEELNAGC